MSIWTGLIDDAAIFPPGDAALADAVTAYTNREGTARDLVASFVVTDQRVPEVPAHAGGTEIPVSVVVTGGAGAIAGACRLAAKEGTRLHAVEVALRDLDDLAGNARRVTAAVDQAVAEGLLAEDVPVFVELPQTEPTHGWLAAADEVAAMEHRLKFRTGGVESHHFPSPPTLAAWVDAALDRETPFKCTAGLHHAVRRPDEDGITHHGFLNVLLATRAAFNGAPREEVVAVLEQEDAGALVEAARSADLAGARRWFTSFGSCSIGEPLDDLTTLGLLEDA